MPESAQQEAVALWKFLESRGLRPSIRSVGRVLRDHGVNFDDHQLRAWLAPFSPRCNRNSTATAPQKTSMFTAVAPQPHRKRTAVTREKEVSQVSKAPDSLRSSGESINAPEAPKKPASARKNAEPDTSWVQPLVEATRAVGKVAISELGPDGRLVLARYHCLKFGNCTKSEGANRRAATKVAAGFGGMSHSTAYGSITVAEYVGYAQKVHALREKAPWFDVWLIRSVVEFDKAGAA